MEIQTFFNVFGKDVAYPVATRLLSQLLDNVGGDFPESGFVGERMNEYFSDVIENLLGILTTLDFFEVKL